MTIQEQWDRLLRRDPVKAAIAGAVQRTLRAPFVPVVPQAADVTNQDITAESISPTDTVIRVNTHGRQGVRYFRVKVSEMI
jgi:hypothetical protein